jgi:hypothetical protein
MNKDAKTAEPTPREVLDFGDGFEIPLFPSCVGAFSYYTRRCIEDVGLLDDELVNVWDHVEHTYRIIQKGYHPPFFWFADLANAGRYLGDIPWSPQTSTIGNRPEFAQQVARAEEHFMRKHGVTPRTIQDTPPEDVIRAIMQIHERYGR